MGLQERRLREKEQRREQILDAGRELILKHGIYDVSVQQIAKLAELSVGTIYLYFDSKEEIFATLQEGILEVLYDEAEKAVAEVTDPSDKIRAIAEVYKRFSEENKKYFDVINYFISPLDVFFPKLLKTQVDQHGNRILSILVEVINEGIVSGLFEKVVPKRCSIIIWATLHGLIQFRKMRDTVLKEENFDELYRYSVDTFIEGLMKKG
ncbi:MAG: TetR/AcrR family transcriptional regulator [Spirochaetes bacterium]|nr:TetR/AcrR family transcriptional regulator [Spirochaetota bacterium]